MDEVRIWALAVHRRSPGKYGCGSKPGKTTCWLIISLTKVNQTEKDTGMPSAVDYSGHAYSGLFSDFIELYGQCQQLCEGAPYQCCGAVAGYAGCIGAPVMLTEATTGGNWSSSNHAVATVTPPANWQAYPQAHLSLPMLRQTAEASKGAGVYTPHLLPQQQPAKAATGAAMAA